MNHLDIADAKPSMAAYPVLRSRRFDFRPFVYSDIERLCVLAGQHRIADSNVGIPYPYTAEFARMWIGSHPTQWIRHHALHWAAIDRMHGDDRRILGYAGLSKIDFENRQAEMRFWVGCGTKRREYAVEWCAAVLEFASSRLEMARVYALQVARHPLAGRVLASLGMRPEAHVRKRVHREGLIEDIVCWGIECSRRSGERIDDPHPGGCKVVDIARNDH